MRSNIQHARLICAALTSLALSGALRAESDGIFSAMKAEMSRSMSGLKFESFKPPYFLAYTLVDGADATLTARYGSITQDSVSRNRVIYVELRYGDYGFDNSDDDYRGAADSVGLESDPVELRHRLWLLTDQAYKQAVKDYLQKQGKKVAEVERNTSADFSREEPHSARLPADISTAALSELAPSFKSVSAVFRKHRHVLDGGITLKRNQRAVYYLNSEGSQVIQPGAGNPYFVYLWARAQCDDGMELESFRTFSVRTDSQLPSEERLKAEAAKLADQLKRIMKAKRADPYTAPAILDAESTGVLFHEALGHRVEGERQRDSEEGQTFKDQVGKKVVPDFLTVEDDPTLSEWNGLALNGHYAYDEEGVSARKVTLVEQGVLKNYLMSRRPIEGFPKSNGHGRAQIGRDPIGRMSNLLVKSSHTVSSDTLKTMLMAECVKRGKPYGLMIRRTRSGDTFTSRGRYQAFRGTPEEVLLVDAKTGEETLVRGVELVGTPLITINKIIATGDRLEAMNAFCGAESGLVPVSTVAPSSLVEEVELQREREDKQRPPILPPPLFEKEPK